MMDLLARLTSSQRATCTSFSTCQSMARVNCVVTSKLSRAPPPGNLFLLSSRISIATMPLNHCDMNVSIAITCARMAIGRCDPKCLTHGATIHLLRSFGITTQTSGRANYASNTRIMTPVTGADGTRLRSLNSTSSIAMPNRAWSTVSRTHESGTRTKRNKDFRQANSKFANFVQT